MNTLTLIGLFVLTFAGLIGIVRWDRREYKRGVSDGEFKALTKVSEHLDTEDPYHKHDWMEEWVKRSATETRTEWDNPHGW
jgi:hypothetical protein